MNLRYEIIPPVVNILAPLVAITSQSWVVKPSCLQKERPDGILLLILQHLSCCRLGEVSDACGRHVAASRCQCSMPATAAGQRHCSQALLQAVPSRTFLLFFMLITVGPEKGRGIAVVFRLLGLNSRRPGGQAAHPWRRRPPAAHPTGCGGRCGAENPAHSPFLASPPSPPLF